MKIIFVIIRYNKEKIYSSLKIIVNNTLNAYVLMNEKNEKLEDLIKELENKRNIKFWRAFVV
jgi:hypothetical protein